MVNSNESVTKMTVKILLVKFFLWSTQGKLLVNFLSTQSAEHVHFPSVLSYYFSKTCSEYGKCVEDLEQLFTEQYMLFLSFLHLESESRTK